MKKPIRDFLIMIVIALVVFFGLRLTLQTYVVEGPSMETNFSTGQRLLVNKVVYKLHPPERGDVIVFHPRSLHLANDAGRLAPAGRTGRTADAQAPAERRDLWPCNRPRRRDALP